MGNYGNALAQFLRWKMKHGSLESLCEEDVKEYLVWRYDNGSGWQTINAAYSSIRKYYESVLGMPWKVRNLPRPRKETVLPWLISVKKVHHLLSHCRSLRDQAFLCLLYGTGLRLGEALNLEIRQIDGDRNKLLVKRGKGHKDRYVDIPESFLKLLRHYYMEYVPVKFLFNGKKPGDRLASRTAQHLIKKNCKDCGLGDSVSAHTFRHCYATHHLEGGTNIVYLQQQLGHRYLKTTARYIHLLKEHTWQIKHPLASMVIEYRPRTR